MSNEFFRAGFALSCGLIAAVSLSACGGGSSATPTSPPVSTSAAASVVTPVTGKTAWNLPTAAQFSLLDAHGGTVSGPLSCVSDNTTALTVAADCSTLTGRRLGQYSVTVSAAGVSAQATVKVIPQAQPLGTHGPASSHGSGQYNLVVTPAGRVLAWGANPYGVLGQNQDIVALTNLALPTAVKDGSGLAELSGIVAVSAGTKTALALSEDGEVYSWGYNSNGELGRATPSNAPGLLPAKVVSATGSGTLQHIVAISIGDNNALALADDGTVYSWGYYSGQPGADPKRTPGQVSGIGGNGVLGNAVAVSAGWNWGQVLLADGKVVSWGFGTDGRQGHGLTYNTTNLPTSPAYVIDDTAQPLSNVVAISAGYDFGLALTTGGQVYAWGSNLHGQIGQNLLGGSYASAVTVKTLTGNLDQIAMVAAGGNHALAMDASGNVYSWGLATSGQLGDGANAPAGNQSLLPRAVVATNGLGQMTGIAALAAGYDHSLALASDGSLSICGSGFRGNLGQGGSSSADSHVPLVVKDESGAGQLSLAPISAWPNLWRRGL